MNIWYRFGFNPMNIGIGMVPNPLLLSRSPLVTSRMKPTTKYLTLPPFVTLDESFFLSPVLILNTIDGSRVV